VQQDQPVLLEQLEPKATLEALGRKAFKEWLVPRVQLVRQERKACKASLEPLEQLGRQEPLEASDRRDQLAVRHPRRHRHPT